jgi:hypothetical protein
MSNPSPNPEHDVDLDELLRRPFAKMKVVPYKGVPWFPLEEASSGLHPDRWLWKGMEGAAGRCALLSGRNLARGLDWEHHLCRHAANERMKAARDPNTGVL